MGLAVLLILVVILTVLLNLLIVVVILSKGKDIHYIDLIIVSLSVSDILQAGVGYMYEIIAFSLLTPSSSPVTTPSAITTATIPATSSTTQGQSILASECKSAGFLVTFLALTSIFHLTGISIERRFILLHPIRARNWMNRKIYAMFVVLPSWLCGLFWAVTPLLGWSSYVREDRQVHKCSVNIAGKDPSHLTYSYNLMFWCYVVPIFVMGYCCNDIRIALRRLHLERTDMGIAGEVVLLHKKKERKVTLMLIAMMITFLCAWTPYAICLLVITAEIHVPSSLFAFAAIFAKLSTIYNPVIYMIFIKDFRTKMRKMFQLKQRNTAVVQQQTPKISLRDIKVAE